MYSGFLYVLCDEDKCDYIWNMLKDKYLVMEKIVVVNVCFSSECDVKIVYCVKNDW